MKRTIIAIILLCYVAIIAEDYQLKEYYKGRNDAYNQIIIKEKEINRLYRGKIVNNLVSNIALSSCCIFGIPLMSSGSNCLFALGTVGSIPAIIADAKLERILVILPIIIIPTMSMFISKSLDNQADKNRFIRETKKREIINDSTKSQSYKDGFIQGVDEYIIDNNMEDL